VDGVPDTVVPGEFTWMMVTGAQGTMVHSMLLATHIPGFDYSSYYQDDSTPPHVRCTGDAYEYGASGFWEQDPIPNTDPGVSEICNIFANLGLYPATDITIIVHGSINILYPLL
jgi:hypothetical protein